MKRIVFFSISILLTVSLFAQRDSYGKYNVGIGVGIVIPYLYSKADIPINSKISNEPGFLLQSVLDYNINSSIMLSSKFGVSLSGTKVSISHSTNVEEYSLMKFTIDLSFGAMYLLTKKSVQPYLLVGSKYRNPLPLKDKFNNTNKGTFALDFGVGSNKLISFTKKFVIKPEITYSFGLSNVNNNPQINNLYINTICLTINFRSNQ